MARTKLSMLAIAASLVFAGTPAAHAQVGGLIRKKVGDAVKGPEKPKEKTKEPDTVDEDSKLPYRLDAESKKAFIAGLQVEIDGREAYKKRLTTLKTPAQYSACQTNTVTNTPEGKKFSEDYVEAMGKLGDNAAGKKPEQIMKEQQEMAEKFTKRSEAMILKNCGEDPTPVINSQRQTFERAERAGAVEFGKVFKRTPSGSDEASTAAPASTEPCIDRSALMLEGDLEVDGGPCHAAEPWSKVAGLLRVGADTTTDEEKQEQYRILKERVEKYCSLPQSMKDQAEANGIKVPGQGKNIYWVFSRGFALWVGPDCDYLLKLFSRVQ
jgi:hypothetical protein